MDEATARAEKPRTRRQRFRDVVREELDDEMTVQLKVILGFVLFSATFGFLMGLVSHG